MDYEKLEQAFYEASLKAIYATGDAYKNLSWFGKNKKDFCIWKKQLY